MAKRVLLPTNLITFAPGTAGSGYLEFIQVPNFDSRKVMAVINITYEQQLIYAVASYAQNLGGNWISDTQVLLQTDTSMMSGGDRLQIIYDDAEIGIYDANGLPIYSTPDPYSERNGLDVNILNGGVIGQVDQPLNEPYGDAALSVAFNQGGNLKVPHMDPVTNDVYTKVVTDAENPVYVSVVSGSGSTTVTQGSTPWITTPTNPSNTYWDYGFGSTTAATPRVVLATDQSTLSVSGVLQLQTVGTLDISATYTTTGNSGATPSTNYSGVSFLLSVGTVTGTNPTMDFKIQETLDFVTWTDIYHFQRVTTSNTVLQTPVIRVSGTWFRYVRTIGGTSPSFVTTVNRVSRSGVGGALIRAFFDRTPNPLTVNSTSASYYVGGCTGLELIVSMGTGGSGTQPHFALQFSEDNSNWYTITATDQTVNTSQTTNAATNLYQPKYARAIVTTAGSSGYTLNYVCIKGYGQ
jgi:hypothetical protein